MAAPLPCCHVCVCVPLSLLHAPSSPPPPKGLDPQIFSSDASDPQKTSDLTTLTNEEDRLEAMMKQASEGYTAAE
jgi:hypothetical protein